ncbi:HNH endonuclease [Luteimonas notoginsengisoli]|uniref:HNH endonuclease n=1 Tax=Luteimonas notoginsengisoli TaxID=1578200 RepID=A0ABV7UUL0_9GAMM
MQLSKPSQLLELSTGDTVTKRNLFDLIQLSKVEGSAFWQDRSWLIGNTPQQGINWIGELPECRAVLIKTKHGSYENDGWAGSSKNVYHYSFKARGGTISYTEKANRVLVDQPDYQYPILLFTEIDGRWSYEGHFSVSGIRDNHVVLERTTLPLPERSRARVSASSETDDSAAIDALLGDHNIPRTERVQLIKARVGQGLFRSRVAAIEQCCRITGIADSRFLIASHIKLWSISSNAEKLDGSNGLLLTPNIDRLFDKGHITFEDDGRVRVSTELPANVLIAWGLDAPIPPKPLIQQQRRYMAYHRSAVFHE